ncbi:uncharacterized protein B4U80_13110 [Leptotrombidium deliense]|uniref:Ig-like domain-containing protein n=1 Tax=Leptotrombidium deliense TaxID=299467 RepID=A0A443SCG8_9ACAR|nr:uncharacterized protein B4U80_13110 [Leptotrombidium deliense]
MSVPEYAFYGKNATLKCLFDEENDELYSIKWYFNKVEFLSFNPGYEKKMRYFKIDEINLNLNVAKNKYGREIELIELKRESEGFFKCEISAEKTFQIDSKEAYMTIVATSNPLIIGHKSVYTVGDILNMTCIANDTIPESHIDWFINDELVAEYFIIRHNRTLATLLLPIQENHALVAKLAIKCISSIKNFITTAVEAKKPIIYGQKAVYNLGEKVEIMCSFEDQSYDLKWVFFAERVIIY